MADLSSVSTLMSNTRNQGRADRTLALEERKVADQEVSQQILDLGNVQKIQQSKESFPLEQRLREATISGTEASTEGVKATTAETILDTAQKKEAFPLEQEHKKAQIGYTKALTQQAIVAAQLSMIDKDLKVAENKLKIKLTQADYDNAGAIISLTNQARKVQAGQYDAALSMQTASGLYKYIAGIDAALDRGDEQSARLHYEALATEYSNNESYKTSMPQLPPPPSLASATQYKSMKDYLESDLEIARQVIKSGNPIETMSKLLDMQIKKENQTEKEVQQVTEAATGISNNIAQRIPNLTLDAKGNQIEVTDPNTKENLSHTLYSSYFTKKWEQLHKVDPKLNPVQFTNEVMNNFRWDEDHGLIPTGHMTAAARTKVLTLVRDAYGIDINPKAFGSIENQDDFFDALEDQNKDLPLYYNTTLMDLMTVPDEKSK